MKIGSIAPDPAMMGALMTVPVMRPLVPDQTEFGRLVDGVFTRAQFTNEGPLVRRLAAELREWLGVDHLQLVSSGASALQMAFEAVGIAPRLGNEPGGEVITTPFTFAASPHAIALRGLTPVFADIDPATLCLDPARVEALVGPRTRAVLATHVYGGPCDVRAFAALGERHGLPIVYDGAHAFGTAVDGRSVFEWGDATALSFHATKIFHTVEGGAVVSRRAAGAERVRVAKAHGIDGAEVPLIGPNAKMSELHAACGLTLLGRLDEEFAARRRLHADYREALAGAAVRVLVPGGCGWNHAYCPILLTNEDAVLRVQGALARVGIEARRYFWPALNTLSVYAGASCPKAENAARRVLCLPFGGWLDEDTVARVVAIVREHAR